MIYFVNFKNLNFEVSVSIAQKMNTTKKFLFKTEIQSKRTTFILNESNILFFQSIPTDSSSHFYVLISDQTQRYRVSKKFYMFLNDNKINNKKTVTIINTKNKNENLDKFYTKSQVSHDCLNVFTSNILIQKRDLIVEPSAGNGSFSDILKNFKCNKTFLDIAPDSNTIKQANFLK